MGDLILYIAAFVFVITLIVLGAWIWRALLEKGMSVPGNNLFTGGREKRIGAIETASIDGRRKLILIRRDRVEHLIMTGGPVDVVIETGIEVTPPGLSRPNEPRLDKEVQIPETEPYKSNSSLEKRLFEVQNTDQRTPSVSDD